MAFLRLLLICRTSSICSSRSCGCWATTAIRVQGFWAGSTGRGAVQAQLVRTGLA